MGATKLRVIHKRKMIIERDREREEKEKEKGEGDKEAPEGHWLATVAASRQNATGNSMKIFLKKIQL